MGKRNSYEKDPNYNRAEEIFWLVIVIWFLIGGFIWLSTTFYDIVHWLIN